MTKNNSKKIVLICDLGGTNVRFGLYTEGQTETIKFDGKYKCADFTSFESAVEYYLNQKEEKPNLCVIGAAGNIDEYNGEVLTTNTPWKASVPKLMAKFPCFKHARMVNDFALQGWALSELAPDQYRPVFNQDKNINLKQGKVVIIGPGTGLGTCLILQDGKNPQTIYTSEAGHSTMPHVDFNDAMMNIEKDLLLQRLKKYYVQKGQRPIVEHIVSGTGISNVYHALKFGEIPAEKSQRIPGEKVEEFAKQGDPVAIKTFKFFNAYLGAHAGTMAATTKTQNIFFCGGLMSNSWIVEQLEASEEFKDQFISRAGLTDAMKDVRFSVSLYADMSTLGAVVCAKDLIETTNNEEEKSQANRKVLMSLALLQAFIESNCPEALPNMEKLVKAVNRFRRIERDELKKVAHQSNAEIQNTGKTRND